MQGLGVEDFGFAVSDVGGLNPYELTLNLQLYAQDQIAQAPKPKPYTLSHPA